MAGLFDLANPALANVSGDKMGYALAPAINQVANSGLEQMMGGLGVKSKTQMVQGILSKIDMNDPNSMIMASSELMKIGMTAEAQQLMKAAQEAQLNSVKMSSEEALIGQRNALANKYGAEVQETLTGKSKTYQIDAAIAQVERLLKEGKITQEQANVAYMNLLKANPELTQAQIENIKSGTSSKLASADYTSQKADLERQRMLATNDIERQKIEAKLRELDLKEADTQSKIASRSKENIMADERKEAIKASTASFEQQANASSNIELANKIDDMVSKGQWKAGASGKINEWVNTFVGEGDETTYQRVLYQKQAITQALSVLPPGPASDADMRLVLSTSPDQFSNPQMLSKYLRAASRAQEKLALLNAERSKYLGKYGVKGLQEHLEAFYKNGYKTPETKDMPSGATLPMEEQPLPESKAQPTSGKKAPSGLADGEYILRGKKVTVRGGMVYE